MSVFFGVVGVAAAATAPSISSNTWAGQTLVATPATSGDALEWYQCDSQGDPCSDTLVSGPDSPTIMAGYTYYVAETGVTTANSSTTPATTADPPSPSPGPSIGGTPLQGDTLSVSPGSWGPQTPDSIVDTWERCNGGGCTGVSTASAYTLGPDDVGDTLEVVETATYGPSQLTAASNGIGPIRPATPTISGPAQQGATLTASGDYPAGASYQWLHCALTCTAIPGATGSSYRLTDADVGSALAVSVSANGVGATSGRTAVVTATTSVGLLTSTSRARVNQTVQLDAIVTSSADTASPDGTVTFFDGGRPIPGCLNRPAGGGGQSVTVTCAASFAVPSATISASFTPGSGVPLSGSGSGASVIAIIPNDATVTLDVPAQVQRDTPVTYTASVTPADDLTGPTVPGGRIRFLDHGRTIRGCGRVRMHGGGATCTTRYRGTGRALIRARYLGSANFHGAASRAMPVRIVRRRVTAITATMQWTFHYTPSYTRILAFVVHGVGARSEVTLRCTGRGCPFRVRVHTITSARPTLDLERGFHGRHLRVQTRLVVTVTRPRFVGKYYRFTIRSRRQPAVLISCLAPGSDRPGAGCRR